MSNTSERHKENVEAKEIAKKQWEQNTKEIQKQEINKRKSRSFTDENIAAYEGPETDRLKNKDRINKS